MATLIPKFLNKANPTGAEPVPDAALLNDTQNLTIPLQPGKTYLFHVVNIGAFAGQHLWFEGHNMTLVEVDGVFVDAAEAEMIYVSAAQRYSFLLTAKNETGTNYAFVGSMDTVSTKHSSASWFLTSYRIYSTLFLMDYNGILLDGWSMIVQTTTQNPPQSRSLTTTMILRWFQSISLLFTQSQIKRSLLMLSWTILVTESHSKNYTHSY
jgi:FtsP/CotA-like multicopper oxidase with cupredoxin domain